MSLKLNVSVSRKVGQPDYGSLGASCALELELPEGLLNSDLDEFQRRLRDAYIACNQAVTDELARHQAPSAHTVTIHGPSPRNGSPPKPNGAAARTNGSHGRTPRPATPSQIKAIHAIARAQRADLEGLLRDECGVGRPEDLSLADASKLIDQLKAAGAG